MDDLIKRQDALRIKVRDCYDHDGILYVPLRDVIKYLKDLPSAQKTGYWIHYDEPQFDYKCSECGYEVWDNSDFPSYYCPNCGAYMKGEEDEQAN